MNMPRVKRFELFQHRPEFLFHRRRSERTRHAGDTNRLQARKTAQLRGCRHLDEQRGADPGERQLLQGIGRARKIITVESEKKFAHALLFPNFFTDTRSSGYFAAACSSVRPSTAASHHFRSERTPADGPSGCAMMPPPAR